MITRICSYSKCGQRYQAARSRGKGYCSSRCRTAAHRARNAGTTEHVLTFVDRWPEALYECSRCGRTWQRYPRGLCTGS